jgi:citrate synthase
MPPSRNTRVRSGLAGVVAGVSSISFIDPRGRLFYRGYDVAELTAQASFEEVAHLLWHGDLPRRAELDTLKADLLRAGTLPQRATEILRQIPLEAQPIAVARTMVSVLGHMDPDAGDRSPAASGRKAVRLAAQLPAAVAAFHRLRQGRPALAPQPGLSHAANYLYMLHGNAPAAEKARALDVALIAHADHEFNASTFAGRVVAATLSDLHSAITAAIGALAGPLHGGASEDVMRLLERIGSMDRVEPVVAEMVRAGAKIPGFGHRVYRAEDPRASVLRRCSERLAQVHGDTRWHQLTRRVEEVTGAGHVLHANVDLYAAPLYAILDIPLDMYSVTFAAGRVTGWTAHIMEQHADNRLIRPLAAYRGPAPRRYVPREARG